MPGEIVSSGTVPVVACPAPTYNDGTSVTDAAKVPPVMQYPGDLPHPPGTQVYGYSDSGGRVYYMLGPAGFRCEHTQIGADGGTQVVLDDPGNSRHFIEMTIATGGVFTNILDSCAYIPAVRDVAASSPGYEPQDCAAAPGVTDTQIPTNQPGLYAAAIRVPKTLTALLPALSWAPLPLSDGTDTPVALYITALTSQQTQESDCALPPALMAVCAADLELFLTTQSDLSAQFALPNLVSAKQSLASFLAGQPPEPSAPSDTPECPAAIDFSLDRQIANRGTAKIPIPGNTIDLPGGLEGAVSVSASLGGATICKRAVSIALSSLTSTGDLTLTATASGAAKGPFTYSLDSTAWVLVPGAPPGQDFTTRFSPAVTAAVDPHLSLNQSGNISLQIAAVELTAIEVPPVKLVSGNQELLEVSMAPDVTLAVEISKQSVERTARDAEDEGLDRQTAIDDTAEQISSNATVAIEEDATGYYGVSISSQAQLFYADLDSQLVEALDGDAALAATLPGDEITDPTSEIGNDLTPAQAAAAAEATGGEATEVESIAEILILLL